MNSFDSVSSISASELNTRATIPAWCSHVVGNRAEKNDLPPSPELQKWWTDFVPQWPIGTKEFYSNVGVVALGFATAQAGGAGYTPHRDARQ